MSAYEIKIKINRFVLKSKGTALWKEPQILCYIVETVPHLMKGAFQASCVKN